jgi:trans-2,3-dihydro-3-hydroxyanthranilate isomerase
MPAYRFVQVDVFTDRPFGGNQLAVFTDARGLSTEQMQALAREMNFSESTFVLPPEAPGAVRRVRIFTPTLEMPFAGHPTIGTTYVLASEGVIALADPETTVELQLKLGLLPVTVVARNGLPEFVWMEQRPAQFQSADFPRAAVAAALGLSEADLVADAPLEVVSTGVPFLMVPLRSLDAVRRARADSAALRRLFAGQEQLLMPYVFSRETESSAHAAHARMFCGHVLNLPEDAATGAAAGPLGAYLLRHQFVAPGQFSLEQGYEMGRPSILHVEVTAEGKIRVGGQTVKVGEGQMYVG